MGLIAGIILAGGQSRRMGGGDKTLLDLAGKPMLGYAIAALRPQVVALAVNANGDASRFARFGLAVVPDSIDGFVGPLAGVLAGMQWTHKTLPGATHVVTVSGDAPFLPADLVAKLDAGLRKDGRDEAIAIARSDGNLHPVIGLWPVALADDLAAALQDGVRKVLHWTDRHGTVPVDFEPRKIGGREVDPFFNANRPEELAQARDLLEADRA